MPTNIALTKKMIAYAKLHHIDVPGLSLKSNAWGIGKRRLAWRVSGHLKEHGRKMRQSARRTAALTGFFFPPSFGSRVVRLARRELGVTEHPPRSNDGPRVRRYQSSTLAYHAPWCASFVRYIYGVAAAQTGKHITWFANPAYVPNWTAATRLGSHFKAVPFNQARPGDFVTLWSSGHIEIVVGRSGDYLICIGGNTSPRGQDANGGGVYRTKRHRSEVTVIGRPV